jgi:hypothetical protein
MLAVTKYPRLKRDPIGSFFHNVVVVVGVVVVVVDVVVVVVDILVSKFHPLAAEPVFTILFSFALVSFGRPGKDLVDFFLAPSR